MRRIAIFFIVLCVAGPAQGQFRARDAEGKRVIGAGTGASCGKWLEDRQQPPPSTAWHGKANWALGFLSGAAVYQEGIDPLKGLDAAAIYAWLDQHCRENPLTPLVLALEVFVRQHPR